MGLSDLNHGGLLYISVVVEIKDDSRVGHILENAAGTCPAPCDCLVSLSSHGSDCNTPHAADHLEDPGGDG